MKGILTKNCDILQLKIVLKFLIFSCFLTAKIEKNFIEKKISKISCKNFRFVSFQRQKLQKIFINYLFRVIFERFFKVFFTTKIAKI